MRAFTRTLTLQGILKDKRGDIVGPSSVTGRFPEGELPYEWARGNTPGLGHLTGFLKGLLMGTSGVIPDGTPEGTPEGKPARKSCVFPLAHS